MANPEQDLLSNVSLGDLGFLTKLHAQHYGVRHEVQQLIDQLDPDAEVIVILKRPSDHSVAFKTFGGIDVRDATYMLAQTKLRILSLSNPT